MKLEPLVCFGLGHSFQLGHGMVKVNYGL